MTQSDKKTTHFGYQEVPVGEKSHLVAQIFNSVASKYDLMNDVMSLGLHRLWKQIVIQEANIRQHQHLLDVASGTGDLAKAFAKKLAGTGELVVSDINESMLSIARERITNAGFIKNITYTLADAEKLPFAANHFDLITIAFGLRNVTDKLTALKSMYRVLKPGGKLLVLEFSKPTSKLINRLYDFYSFNIIPNVGGLIARDKASYQYLVESIRMHPDQDTLKSMMNDAGFEDVTYTNFHNGIVALHKGYKY